MIATAADTLNAGTNPYLTLFSERYRVDFGVNLSKERAMGYPFRRVLSSRATIVIVTSTQNSTILSGLQHANARYDNTCGVFIYDRQ